ncbi:MAG: sulfatase, partial [Gemmatimonadota bacterium]
PAASIVRLTLWSALVAGIGEVALRLVARQVLPEPVFLNPASVWLGPLSALVIFAPCIALAWGVGRLRSARGAWFAAVAAAAFLAAFDVLLLVPRLHLLALALLAAGVASQVLAVAKRWPPVFARLVGWSTSLLAAVSVVGGVAIARGDGAVQLAEGEAADGAPSVLLLVLDTVRALELSAYGFERPTSPQLATLATEGVKFDRAVATAPWTLPTHATLFTGRFQRDLSVGWTTALDTAPRTLAEHFSASGYATGGFVANMRYTSREYGLARGFQVYRDYALNGSQLMGSTMLGRRVIGAYNDVARRYILVGRKDAKHVVDEFLEWQGAQGERPYFAFLNFFDAHEPYAPEAPYDLMFSGREPPTRALEVGRRHPPAELQGLRDAYDGAIASLDAQLGRLFDELRRRGALERTIVVVTADHGEEFAEHGHVSHGNGLHFPALHVPLLIRWPDGGVPRGLVVPSPVSLADVPATIIELAGGQDEGIPGASLAPLWRGGSVASASPVLSELYWVPNQPDWYPVAGGDMRSLVYGRFHLIAGPGTHEELYDIMADPFERRNLIGGAVPADTLAAMREALAALKGKDRGGR